MGRRVDELKTYLDGTYASPGQSSLHESLSHCLGVILQIDYTASMPLTRVSPQRNPVSHDHGLARSWASLDDVNAHNGCDGSLYELSMPCKDC